MRRVTPYGPKEFLHWAVKQRLICHQRIQRHIWFMRNFVLGFCLLFAAAAASRAEEVAVELVLLADSSGSITEDEIQFQRRGYADALTDPQVLDAIKSTLHGSIAVVYVEWADRTAVVADWAKIDSAGAAAAFAEDLLAPPRLVYGRNAIGDALFSGKQLIEENEFEAWRKVIDFSGDSPRNFSGRSIDDARDEVVAAGITINALPILCRFCDTTVRYPNLAEIYERTVIGGPGAFVVSATSEKDLAAAIRRKLILEISGKPPEANVALLD